jgi:hypothetical protein
MNTMKTNEWLVIYGSGLILTFIALLYFTIIGYPLVNTTIETLNLRTPPIYMIPVFFTYGILLGEICWLWIKKERKESYILLIQCIIIGLFALTRYILMIPFSGHAIILFFYLIHYLFIVNKKYLLRILIGFIILGIIIFYKIFIWSDLFTFLLGGMVGAIISLIGIVYKIKNSLSRKMNIN